MQTLVNFWPTDIREAGKTETMITASLKLLALRGERVWRQERKETAQREENCNNYIIYELPAALETPINNNGTDSWDIIRDNEEDRSWPRVYVLYI